VWVNWLIVGWWLQAKGLIMALLTSIVFLMDPPPTVVWLWLYGICAALYFGGLWLENYIDRRYGLRE
jgi:hypothetical protein